MPELRKDPVTSRWVIIATERGKDHLILQRSTVKNMDFVHFVMAMKIKHHQKYLHTEIQAQSPILRAGKYG